MDTAAARQGAGGVEPDGFQIVEEALAAGVTDRLIAALAELGAGYGMRNLLRNCGAVKTLAADLKPFVRPWVGEQAHAVRGLFFDKLPGANWEVTWHQDPHRVRGWGASGRAALARGKLNSVAVHSPCNSPVDVQTLEDRCRKILNFKRGLIYRLCIIPERKGLVSTRVSTSGVWLRLIDGSGISLIKRIQPPL